MSYFGRPSDSSVFSRTNRDLLALRASRTVCRSKSSPEATGSPPDRNDTVARLNDAVGQVGAGIPPLSTNTL